jgi:cytochrome c551/c552
MSLRHVGCTLVVLALIAGGCGKKAGESQGGAGATGGGTGSGASPESAAGGGAGAGVSKYDSGPRAGESPVDAVLAKQGEALFTSKGCVACHGFGKKITCPDMAPVPMQRTAAWMEQQILHPEVMTKNDPISHGLMKEYKLQMPNQGVTPPQAKALIEFIKRKAAEAGAK